MALFGIDNQTDIEKNMPLRVIGYDGAAYRQQLLQKRKPVPVITLVLHFGTKERWNEPCSIKELLDIPENLGKYVNDYSMHVFDIAWLTEEQLVIFESDFGIVANFFVQKRKYASILSFEKERVMTMCDVAERLEQRGIRRGIKQGIERGVQMEKMHLYRLVASGKLSVLDASQELEQTEEEFLDDMRKAGYGQEYGKEGKNK